MGRREESGAGVTTEEKRARNAAKSRAYRAKHPDRVKAADRRSYERNQESRLAYAARPDVRAKKARRMKAARAADPRSTACNSGRGTMA